MATNVFFTNGLMSTLSASVIAEKLHARDINILCVERVGDIFKKDYYKLNRMIETYFPWTKIFYIDLDSRGNLLKKHIIKYYKAIKYYKSFKKYVNDNLREFGSIERIYATTPSMMWSLVDTKTAKLNIIEHSIQEYNLFNFMRKKSSPITLFRRLFDIVIGYRFMGRGTIPSRFVFLDGERCDLIRKRQLINDICSLSINASDIIFKIFKHVKEEYKKKYSREYEEIAAICDQMNNFKNRYIYLPSGEVPGMEYDSHLESQIKDISLNDSCILIKNHPVDLNNYSQYFEKYNCKVFTLKHEANGSIPVELLMVMMNMPTLWGSYSSALIYSYWWFGTVPILSEGSSLVSKQVAFKEYKQFINDFHMIKANK